jgi:peptide/nickel transport system substrate-binding protein/oligopeptide transport system substrate-binding protein
MNQTVTPFNDIRVRQAFCHAVDSENIVKQITKQGSVPAKGILPAGIAGFDPNFKGYAYDPAKTRQLLAEAGYPGGRGIPPIEVWTVSKSESVKQELAAYQRYLADVGIQLVPKVANNWKEFIGLINAKKAPMFYAAWYADYPDPDNFLYVLAHSKSPTNRMAYHNPEVDNQLELARHETDYMKRVQMYREIEKQVMSDALIICQHTNSFNCLIQPWVKGVEVGYLGPAYIPLRGVKIEQEILLGFN